MSDESFAGIDGVDSDFWNDPALLALTSLSVQPAVASQTHVKRNHPEQCVRPIVQTTSRNVAKRSFSSMNDGGQNFLPVSKRPRVERPSQVRQSHTVSNSSLPTTSTVPRPTLPPPKTQPVYQMHPLDRNAPTCDRHHQKMRRCVSKKGIVFWRCPIPEDQGGCGIKFENQLGPQQMSRKETKVFSVDEEIINLRPPTIAIRCYPADIASSFFRKRSYSFMAFDREAKHWHCGLSEYSAVKNDLRDFATTLGFTTNFISVPPPVLERVLAWSSIDPSVLHVDNDFLERLPPKLQHALYPFQQEGLKFLVSKKGRGLVADEMGLGKSIQAIACAAFFRDDWPLLIVTPASLRLTWKQEVLKWLGEDMVQQRDVHVIQTGKELEREPDFPRCLVTILSYNIAAKFKERLLGAQFQMVILDESHAIKEITTKRSQALIPIVRRAKRAVLLSGTPSNNRPRELFTQIDSLSQSKDFLTQRLFEKRYCDGKRGRYAWEAVGATNTRELHCLLTERVMIRRLKKDVLPQLPDKIRSAIYLSVEQSENLQRCYKKAMTQLDQQSQSLEDVLEIDPRSANLPPCILKLYHTTALAKLTSVQKFLKTFCEDNPDQKVLVFAHHKDVLRGIYDYARNPSGLNLGSAGVMKIVGDTPEEERVASVARFQTQEKCRIAVLSIMAAGTGLTLTKAQTVMFAELSWSPAYLLQCEDRAHRISQEKCVRIMYLLGEKSLDERIWEMICKKIRVTTRVLSDRDSQFNFDVIRGQHPE